MQEDLDAHEAICHRLRDPGGRSRHEFPAMVAQLLLRLGTQPAAPVTAAAPEPEQTPVTDPTTLVGAAEVEALRAQLRAQDAEIADLQQQLGIAST